MNLLSIGAAYGVVVALFQWGWGRSLIGLDEAVPLASFVPMMMFAILFGLSMDYEVFILSGIREECHRGHTNIDPVVEGLGSTAKVITAAAPIMISVFLGLVASDDPVVKMMGVGLAAVAVDATIVRMVLVPSTIALVGDPNWWLPRWLDRLLPTLDIEASLTCRARQRPGQERRHERERLHPEGFTLARTTDVFDNDTVPAGPLRAHRVADGIWGRLGVCDGQVRFVFEDAPDEPITVDAGGAVAIPPARPHHVELDGPARFAVEFYRPDTTLTDHGVGLESTGLA